MSKKHRKNCRCLNYIDHLFIVISTIAECVSISVLVSLVGILIGITSSANGLKICAITTGIKKYESIINKKKHDKIVLLVKSKLISKEVLISKALTDSNITHDEFTENNYGLVHTESKKTIQYILMVVCI